MIGKLSISIVGLSDGEGLRGRIRVRIQLCFKEGSEIVATRRMHWRITRHAHLHYNKAKSKVRDGLNPKLNTNREQTNGIRIQNLRAA